MSDLRIKCDWCSPEALKDLLAGELAASSGVQLRVREAASGFRAPAGVDATVLVAVVGGAGAAVAALINGIFRLLEKKHSDAAKVILRGADGTTVEAPATATQEQIQEFVELARRLQSPVIKLIGGEPKTGG